LPPPGITTIIGGCPGIEIIVLVCPGIFLDGGSTITAVNIDVAIIKNLKYRFMLSIICCKVKFFKIFYQENRVAVCVAIFINLCRI